ncbi:MAG: UDP-N-acetylmuramoyl-tripeptide--D-alanyl-D-alanine ligase [Trueperaceae bacterium]
MTLDLATLQRALGDHLLDVPDPPPGPASGVRFHSDRVRPGDAFFALQGAATHGVRFADDALARGAAFVVSDRPHPGAVVVDDAGAALLALGRAARADRSGPLVGITGSAGKTTTKGLLAAALDAPASPGNLNTPYALATVLVDLWLAGDGGRPLVLELGVDRTGDMALLTELVRPTHGIVTLIAPAHLQGLGDLAGVAREKGALLRAATTARYASDAAWRRLPDELRAGVRRYRVDGRGDGEAAGGDPDGVTVGRHVVRDAGDRLRVVLAGGDVELALPGAGRAFAENALAALVVAVDLGVPPRMAADRIERARVEAGRLTPIALGDLRVLDDTYNANPAAVAAALEVLARAPRPHAIVLGSMLELGDDSAEHHRDVGRRVAAHGADLVWTVGADATAIADTCGVARHFTDAREAAAAVDDLPRRGTLLVKGSRGIGLEAVVAALRGSLEPAAATATLPTEGQP